MADLNITKPFPTVLPSQQGLTAYEQLVDCLEKLKALYARDDLNMVSSLSAHQYRVLANDLVILAQRALGRYQQEVTVLPRQ